LKISRTDIVEHLKQAGQPAEADRAAAELPDQIDVEDSSIQERFGVDPKELLGQIGSGIGDQA